MTLPSEHDQKMQLLYQEENPGDCAEIYIDGEKVEFIGRDEMFEKFDQNRMFPADGSMAKLKLPGEVFAPEGDVPEVDYQVHLSDTHLTRI